MEMRFHWLRCRTSQKQFRTYWQAGLTNIADYVIKNHAPIHHHTIRPLYLTASTKLAYLQKKSWDTYPHHTSPAISTDNNTSSKHSMNNFSSNKCTT
jgi:hypothetical protein